MRLPAAVPAVRLALPRPAPPRRPGYLDQVPRFYACMRGRELLELGGRLGGLDGHGLRTRVNEQLERAGLAACRAARCASSRVFIEPVRPEPD